jgi:hypothetical protein
LREFENYEGPINIIVGRTEFESVDLHERKSMRRFDLFLPDFQIGVEVKPGRICFQKSVRDQIYKDYHLLKQKVVKDIWWFLFYGASQKVLTEFEKRNLKYIDLGLNDFDSSSDDLTS